MDMWEELQTANWVSERDNQEWRDRAIRAEAQTEVLLEVVRTALETGAVASEAPRRMRAV